MWRVKVRLHTPVSDLQQDIYLSSWLMPGVVHPLMKLCSTLGGIKAILGKDLFMEIGIIGCLFIRERE